MKRFVKDLMASFGYELHKRNIMPLRTDIYESLYDRGSLQKRLFYNIGAGAFNHPYWTNIDFHNQWYKQNSQNISINHDLTGCEPLPLFNDSAEAFYCSHVIEHITDSAVTKMFQEVLRVLKPGGLFRITAPDINLWYRAFIQNDRWFWADSIKHYSQPEVMRTLKLNSMNDATIGTIFQYYFSACTSPLTKCSCERKFSDMELMDLFNEYSFEDALTHICSFSYFDPNSAGYHINWFNAGKVIGLLKAAGFSKITASAFGQSANPIFRDISLFDNTVPEWSFYVEAVK